MAGVKDHPSPPPRDDTPQPEDGFRGKVLKNSKSYEDLRENQASKELKRWNKGEGKRRTERVRTEQWRDGKGDELGKLGDDFNIDEHPMPLTICGVS